MKILVVEDDRYTGESLSKILTAHHYTVDRAVDGQTGLELALRGNPDVIVLDLQLPKLDGISVCRQLRSAGKTTPILILTAIDSSDRIVDGLDTGADDYMVKPFDPGQLLARIRALSRRRDRGGPESVLTWGKLRLDQVSARVTHDRQPIVLRPKEYSLLELFLRNPQRIFSREAILDRLWTFDDCPSEHAVTNLIKDLRQRLKNAGVNEDSIETVYGQGYRLKPPPADNGAQSHVEIPRREESMRVYPGERARPLEEIEKEFTGSLVKRIANFESLIRTIRSGRGDREHRQLAIREAHRLAGSLGTFGYARGSETARAIEHFLLGTSKREPMEGDRLEQLLGELKEATRPTTPPKSDRLATRSTLLLIGANAAELRETLQLEASDRGIRLETAPDRSSAMGKLEEMVPEAIVLHLGAGEIEEGFQILDRLNEERYGQIPVLILAEEDSWELRVRAARSGSEGYLAQPLTPTRLWSAIAGLYPPTRSVTATVLIVDDDPGSLSSLTALFQERAIEVVGVSDPRQFWQVLTATEPDLLLLDLQMPDCTGIELCKVTRQDPEYAYLPIVFVSAQDDPATIAEVFAAGADDFIGKPNASLELVTRALSHLERARLRQRLTRSHRQQSRKWQQLAYLDPLTRVGNRRAFDETLPMEWQNGVRSGQPIALLLCDIDFFKLYNDHYGHPAGDVCLHRVAGAIQSCLASTTDLVARYGGEEFALILPNTTLNGALTVAERIRQAIVDLQIVHERSKSGFVTVSLGIAGILPKKEISPAILVETADQALYTAKSRGRNTYCLYR